MYEANVPLIWNCFSVSLAIKPPFAPGTQLHLPEVYNLASKQRFACMQSGETTISKGNIIARPLAYESAANGGIYYYAC